jgi:methyl-accepting chemotaxis protein
MSTPTLSFPGTQQLNQLVQGLASPTANSTSPAIITETLATPLNLDDGRVPGAPANVPGALASGNAAKAFTAIKKSNQTVSHACDSSTYVGSIVFQAGALAGNIIAGIRAGIKAIQKLFGINPSSTSLINKLKKLAQWISDQVKWINKITTALQQFIAYVNAIKQFLYFILALPAVLLNYFKDCVSTLKKQLVTGYNSAFDETSVPSDSDINDLNNSFQEVQNSISQFNSAVKAATATAAAATISLVVPTTINSGNTEAQQAATQNVFTAAGFPDASKNFGGKP